MVTPVNNECGRMAWQAPAVDKAALAAERYRLLIRQLQEEGLSQRAIGDRLGISQGAVSFYLGGQRKTQLEVLSTAMERLKLSTAFFFEEMDEEPDYHDYVGGRATRVEDTWVDKAAWLELERSGRVDEIRQQGLPEENIQRIRRWQWRGEPVPRDYERLLEAALLGTRGEPAQELEEARQRRRAAGKPSVSLRPKKKS